MKSLYEIKEPVGSDGLIVEAAVKVDSQVLKVELAGTYPIGMILEPATKAVDDLLDKLEKAIPGSWDKPLIEKVKEEYKEKLIELLTA